VSIKPVEPEVKSPEVKSEQVQVLIDIPTPIDVIDIVPENCTPKPAPEEKSHLLVESSPPNATESSQTESIHSGDTNQETLVSMGFTDQKKNQEALASAKGDLVTAVQILLGERMFFRWF